ncbi:MAG: thioredoxin domain-containing protein, partial [Candidatus Eremiobacteraeota bacterium]|nr:thioredoxin domain-containing protein [Candidatus Eremiobacteraeota bacterium]
MSAFHFSPRPNRAAEIHWREWSEAPFAQAERDEKPVLLAISAVWCHWCHVMDETTYSSPAVISLINDRFVPIRVDNDRRPDINARYNMGGWPTTALLTPHGEILKGGTYIPPDAMISLLDQIAQLYAEPDVRSSIARRAAEIKDRRTDASVRPEPSALDADTVPLVEEALWQSFDSDYGGFGTEPKFPQVEVLHFLLDLCARSQDDRAQTMLCKTLRAMADGGMYDHVEGGFFRYSTTRDYSVPHFEKMLEDLSGLLLACAKAAALFGDGALAKIAVDTKGYMDRRLWNDAFGAYGGSQDADEEYYALDEGARRNAKVPFVDSTVYASWNAAAARALILSEPLLAGCGADVRGWTERGLEVLETLWSKLMSDGLMCRYFDGASGVRGLLGDQAWSIWAALSAFSVTGTLTWLHRTGELIAAAEVLYSGDAQGYLDRPPAPDDPG